MEIPVVEITEDFSNIDQDALSETGTNKSDLETDKYGFVGGKEYTDPEKEKTSVEKLRKSETKWLEMLDNWDKWMAKKFSKVKKRCRKGIPSSLRGRAWQLLSGSKHMQTQNKGVFENLLKAEAVPQVVEDIDKDLHRQFPFHEMFAQKGGTGQQDLRDILYANAIYNPRDGYCQAQAPIAAVLLMHMPAEEAFWCMVAMFESYIPGYFSPGLEAVQVDGDVMQGILRNVSPAAHNHLNQHCVTPMLYCTEWFMCIFSRTLPWPCMLRLWDMFFCEGIKVVFRCSLVILKTALGKEILQKLPGMYETLDYLKRFDFKDWEPDLLMNQIADVKITEEDLENEHKKQLKKHRPQNPDATLVCRKYKHSLIHAHGGALENFNNLKSKKKLSTVSVNSPIVIEQLEHERKKKKDKTNSIPLRYKKNLTLFAADHRRRSDTFMIERRSQDLSKFATLKGTVSSLSIPDTASYEGSS